VSALSPDRWRVLAPLLDHALDLTGPERETWLAALRARAPHDASELERLLADDATGWLATTHRERSLRGLGLDPTSAGLVLGAWTLERPLGRGGMGTVWLASRSDGRFNGHAAVKLLHPSLAAGEGALRFRREGEVLARLTHPGIARLYDAGVTSNGQPYLVLEFVDGEPLDAWCVSRGLSIAARLALMDQVLAAVAHAHAHGVVHRDLKPSNLYVAREGVVKLLDFGIAQLADDGSDEARGQPYTPRYAAPEQVRGDVVTTATDVFALGVVLHELLGGPEPTVDAQGRVVHAPMPSNVPRDLAAIVQRAVQPDPAARYETVAAMADDLRRFRTHEPVVARAGGAGYRARRFVRRHRPGMIAASVAAVALIGSAVLSAQQAAKAERQRDLALVSERRARVMSEVLLSMLTEVPSADTTVRAVEGLRRTRVLLNNYLSTDDREHARLALELARQFVAFARSAEADSLLFDAVRLARAAGDVALEAEARCVLGGYTDPGQSPEAVQAEFAALRASIPADAWRARATCNMTESRRLMMNLAGDSASAIAQEAVALAEAAGDTVSLFYATLLYDQTVADSWSSVGYPAMVQRHARVLAVYERLGLGQSTSSMQVARGLAALEREQGRIRTADSTARRMLQPLEQGERWRGAPPALLIEQAQLAHLLNRSAESREWYRRTLAVIQAQGAPILEVRTRHLFVHALAQQGEVREARVQLDSLDRAMAIVSNTAFEAARVRALASLYRAEGRLPAAAALLDSLLRARGYPERPKLIDWPDVMRDYALLQFALGDTANARRAVHLVHSVYGTDTVSVNGSHRYAELQLLESRLFARGGDSAAARESAASARRGLAIALGAEHALTRTAVAWADSLAGTTLGVTVNRRAARDDVP
jgi:eukaryotic-like serine/threonine-protein kinase